MVGTLLLEPDVTRMVVGQFDDQGAFVFGEGGGNLLDELLLPLNINRREQLILVNGLEQVFVLRLTLLLGIRERRYVPKVAFFLESFCAPSGQFKEFF